ncbi:hypothetical protein ACFPN4_01210 [Ureibacillus thermophilus]|uniref:hypothetical protein n=1 Tax=Ureibacillus thermophilus TaxID=367743 RepID=UPI00360C12F2
MPNEYKEDRGIIQFDATIINLVSKDETINILYNEIPIFQDYYFGKILQKGKIITFEFEQDEIIKEQNETDLEKFQFTKEDIVVSDDEADRIGTQAWWTADGCLPGGYQHCGGNCGYGLDHGGGSPINSTDVCCIAHDRCYSVFGDGDNCCDKELVSCVSGHDTWAAVGIRAFFGPQALFCSY